MKTKMDPYPRIICAKPSEPAGCLLGPLQNLRRPAPGFVTSHALEKPV